jgi:transposase
MRKAYSSDISRDQFALISAVLEAVKVKTKEREVDLYEIFCAILYRMKNGCTWENLPHDFPPYSTVYYYFRKWKRVQKNGFSTIDYALSIIEEYHRILSRRDVTPSMLIVDSKTVQNADTAEEKGYDGAKKKTGVKIHGAVDILGFPYALCVTTANVSDRDGAVIMFSSPHFPLTRLEKILFDGAYTVDDFAAVIKELVGAEAEVVKRSDLHKFVVIPKRWIVERSFGWLDKCRLLWKNCEGLLSSTLGFVKLAFVSILLRRFKKIGNYYVK